MGKSFLTSNVIDRYLSVAPIRADSEHASSCTDEGFAFFYCDRSIPERQNSTDILRSLVAQLAGPSTNKPSIHPQIDKLCGHPDASRPALGIASCKEILIDLINTYPRSTLILDAFDECDWKSRSNLKIAFRHLVTSADKPVKIFVSSRPVKGFPRYVNPGDLIQISTKDNKNDIARYIDEQMETCLATHDVVWSPQLCSKVRETLLDKSGGMCVSPPCC